MCVLAAMCVQMLSPCGNVCPCGNVRADARPLDAETLPRAAEQLRQSMKDNQVRPATLGYQAAPSHPLMLSVLSAFMQSKQIELFSDDLICFQHKIQHKLKLGSNL